MAVADKAPAMLEKAADLLRQLYPPETEVVPRAVERLVVLPSALRLPIGQSHKLNVLAFDQDGTLLPNVTLVFQSGDEGRVAVSSDGVVTALAPGEATVQVQALGRPTTAGAASVTVQVLAPTLGFRGGATVAGTAGQAENPLVFGLRLTPSAAFQTTAQRVDLSRGLENPLTFLTGFFSSLLGGGRVTLDLDARPSQDLTVMLEAMQRSSSGYFGTGVGLVAPLRQGIESGLAVRLDPGDADELVPGPPLHHPRGAQRGPDLPPGRGGRHRGPAGPGDGDRSLSVRRLAVWRNPSNRRRVHQPHQGGGGPGRGPGLLPGAEVLPVEVASGVRNQPLSQGETVAGAGIGPAGRWRGDGRRHRSWDGGGRGSGRGEGLSRGVVCRPGWGRTGGGWLRAGDPPPRT